MEFSFELVDDMSCLEYAGDRYGGDAEREGDRRHYGVGVPVGDHYDEEGKHAQKTYRNDIEQVSVGVLVVDGDENAYREKRREIYRGQHEFEYHYGLRDHAAESGYDYGKQYGVSGYFLREITAAAQCDANENIKVEQKTRDHPANTRIFGNKRLGKHEDHRESQPEKQIYFIEKIARQEGKFAPLGISEFRLLHIRARIADVGQLRVAEGTEFRAGGDLHPAVRAFQHNVI